MAGKTVRSEDRKTPLVRIAFADTLFKAREAQDAGKKPKFGCTFLFPKSLDISPFKQDAQAVLLEALGEQRARDLVAAGKVKTPFLDGDGPQAVNGKTGQRYEGFAGHIFTRCTSTIQPKCFDRNVMPAGPDTIYSGCFVYGVIHAFHWHDPRNGDGVSFGVSMVQFAKDGERMAGGGPDPDQYFEKIESQGAAPAATQGGAGAGGLFG